MYACPESDSLNLSFYHSIHSFGRMWRASISSRHNLMKFNMFELKGMATVDDTRFFIQLRPNLDVWTVGGFIFCSALHFLSHFFQPLPNSFWRGFHSILCKKKERGGKKSKREKANELWTCRRGRSSRHRTKSNDTENITRLSVCSINYYTCQRSFHVWNFFSPPIVHWWIECGDGEPGYHYIH